MKSVQSAKDLVTHRKDVIDGFRQQSERKRQESERYFETANYFRTKSADIKSIDNLIHDTKLHEFITAACFLSRKSLSHIDEEAQKEIIGLSIEISKINEKAYVDRLVEQYLLTSGDSMGGRMRNIIGQQAQIRLACSIICCLKSKSVEVQIKKENKSKKVTEIIWGDRRLVFDKKPNLIGKSVDFILVRGSTSQPLRNLLESWEAYLACGELKGGIDPAGADEHWKTASKAIQRIRDSFKKKNREPPKMFFIGAAIENSMADEIFDEIGKGKLIAGNLLKEDQLEEVTEILVEA